MTRIFVQIVKRPNWVKPAVVSANMFTRHATTKPNRRKTSTTLPLGGKFKFYPILFHVFINSSSFTTTTDSHSCRTGLESSSTHPHLNSLLAASLYLSVTCLIMPTCFCVFMWLTYVRFLDKSVSFEKSVSFSDEPPDMNSPKQHSPQHAGK